MIFFVWKNFDFFFKAKYLELDWKNNLHIQTSILVIFTLLPISPKISNHLVDADFYAAAEKNNKFLFISNQDNAKILRVYVCASTQLIKIKAKAKAEKQKCKAKARICKS